MNATDCVIWCSIIFCTFCESLHFKPTFRLKILATVGLLSGNRMIPTTGGNNMKKLKKRLTAAAAAAIVMASAGITASAVHINPNTSYLCNSKYRMYGDLVCVGTSKRTHSYSCTVTYYAYRHTKYCVCRYIFGEGAAYTCTEIHSCSESVKRDHPIFSE